jgi:hypothetical protein
MFAGEFLQSVVAKQDMGAFELWRECCHFAKPG